MFNSQLIFHKCSSNRKTYVQKFLRKTKSIFSFIKETTQTMHNVLSSSNKPFMRISGCPLQTYASSDLVSMMSTDNAASFSAQNVVGAAPKDTIRL